MWHWATSSVPVDPFDPSVAADARQRLADALVEPVPVEPTARPERAASHGSTAPRHPGLSPGFRAPSWWKGDRAAFATSVQAAGDLGYKGTGIPTARPGRAPARRRR